MVRDKLNRIVRSTSYDRGVEQTTVALRLFSSTEWLNAFLNANCSLNSVMLNELHWNLRSNNTYENRKVSPVRSKQRLDTKDRGTSFQYEQVCIEPLREVLLEQRYIISEGPPEFPPRIIRAKKKLWQKRIKKRFLSFYAELRAFPNILAILVQLGYKSSINVNRW